MLDRLPAVRRTWEIARPDAGAVSALAEATGVSHTLAHLLVDRGLADPEGATAFLDAGPRDLHPHGLLRGVDRAVEAIMSAIARGERITVYGDYDVDGLTGSTILFWVIRKLKGECDIFVPHRNREGYGLSVEALSRLAAAGTRLVVTVDSGTSAIQEISAARELGLTVVVLDHHHPPEALPDAAAFINPLQPGCAYPFKGLASVGLAYKLGAALLEASGLPDVGGLVRRFSETTIDIVAVGTIGDMVPLVGENRALVRMGLARLSETEHHGFRCLLEQDGVERGHVTGEWVAFKLVPRINAAGRIADPGMALSFLLSRHAGEAAALARNLSVLNRKRMRLVDRLWMQLLESREQWAGQDLPVAVVHSPYKGLMGLLASRMKDATGRPSIALASDGKEAAGSGRSIEGFHLTQALASARDVVVRYGGHSQASGLTVETARVPELAGVLNRVARERLTAEMCVPRLRIAAEIGREELAPALLDDLDRLGPFGTGNPRPLFLMRRVPVRDATRMGAGGRHVRLACRNLPDGTDVLGFDLARPALAAFERSASLDLVFAPHRESAGGRTKLLLKVEDLRVPEA
jgi:single-stranded-DNA-specific exonuclease